MAVQPARRCRPKFVTRMLAHFPFVVASISYRPPSCTVQIVCNAASCPIDCAVSQWVQFNAYSDYASAMAAYGPVADQSSWQGLSSFLVLTSDSFFHNSCCVFVWMRIIHALTLAQEPARALAAAAFGVSTGTL